MRRAQSLRHNTRPSIADRSHAFDDLGVLHEQPDESPEEALRRQLLAKERENDKLQAQLLALQDQLAQRPSLERVQALEKEYNNQEVLLIGTQRENERCMAELERAKIREKMLERELAKLAGENWQTSLDIAPSATSSARGAFASTKLRSATLNDDAADGRTSPNAPTSPSSSTIDNVAANLDATRAYLEQVRLLVLGVDQRLQTRDEKLSKTLERAEAETTRLAALRVQVDAA